MNASKLLTSKLALPAIALIGLIIFAAAKKLAPGPQQTEQQEIPIAVALTPIEVKPQSPYVSGHGVVKASVELQQIAEVSARVEWLNPALIAGAMISEGESLIRLEATDYQLAQAQADAQLNMVKAQQQELLTSENSLKQSLILVKNKVQLAEQELKRKQNLAKKNSLSASQLDAERQKLIGLQQEQVSLQKQLNVLPSQENNLKAQLNSANAAIEQQQRNIDRTHIRMPFNGRIRSVSVEVDAFKNQGQVLFEAIGVEQVEIEAQFSLDKLRPFIELAFAKNEITTDISDQLEKIGLTANVRLPLAPDQVWQGKVIALRESLTSGSNTLGAVIHVDHPYKDIIPGKRPPLLAGLQVSAELMAQPHPLIALPLSALHSFDNQYHYLYLAFPQEKEKNKANITHRLQKMAVKPMLLAGNQVFFKPEQLQQAIQRSAQVITNDLTPAIEGMALTTGHGEQ